MSKLNVDQKTINELFSDTKADFLIPDYQRPYAWSEEQCLTLWNDIFDFAFPGADYSKFDKDNDEYFLGPIVTFKNKNKQQEIIDGQQRLTTLMLLLRAFYSLFGYMQDDNAKRTREAIEKCIWKTDEFGRPDTSKLKIDSEVATDNDKEEFLTILRTGEVKKDQKSTYAKNYRFFQKQIDEFLHKYPAFFAYLPQRIMNNCILLPIEAESQDTALRIFSTLNDRGLPLSDSDIFKAQFYKYYSSKGEKDRFIERWKALEEKADKIFHPITGTPMDELFTRYMYYVRATRGLSDTTTIALRKFYENDNYALMYKNETLDNLETLLDFWNDVTNQDVERFSIRVLRRLFVLSYAPNGMWRYFTSVYFMKNKDAGGKLDDELFYNFLNTITAFIWAYSVFKPGVNSLRTPVYAEMLKIIEGKPVDFANFKFDEQQISNMFRDYNFYNMRPITKSMLAWWAFHDDSQPLMSLETQFDIEHIFAKNRVSHETMANKYNVEKLGNKAILEKRINIRASDYKFGDKKKYYYGFESQGKKKEGTKVKELLDLANAKSDFSEDDILTRHASILDGFIDFLKANNLIKEP